MISPSASNLLGLAIVVGQLLMLTSAAWTKSPDYTAEGNQLSREFCVKVGDSVPDHSFITAIFTHKDASGAYTLVFTPDVVSVDFWYSDRIHANYFTPHQNKDQHHHDQVNYTAQQWNWTYGALCVCGTIHQGQLPFQIKAFAELPSTN